MEAKVKRTERGWAGHFICADRCKFRRNTLLELGEKRVVVSTVGALVTDSKIVEVGFQRYYETMAFVATYQDNKYWDADVTQQVYFDSPWRIDYYTDADNAANDMHEKVVGEITKKLARK